MKFKHYLFDLDGTIVETKYLHQRAFNLALQDYNLPIIKDGDLPIYEAKPSYDKILIYNTIHDKKITLPESFLARKQFHSMSLIKKAENICPSGIHEVFSSLSKAGKTISICSNCTLSSIFEILTKADILHFIPVSNIFHNKSCRPKPSPEMYQLAIKNGGIDESDCVIFEDGEVGIRSAMEASKRSSVIRVLNPESLVKLF